MGPLWCHWNSPIGGSSSTRALIPCDTPPNSSTDLIASPNVKTMKRQGTRVRSLVRNTLGVKGRAKVLGWGLGWVTSMSIIHTDLHKPNNKLISAYLEHFWCTKMATIDSQNSPWPGLGEATTFPLTLFYVSGHGANTQMSFCPRTPKLGIPKFPKLGLSWLWRPIPLCVNLRLRWSLKQIIALVDIFSMICCTPLAHKEIKAILDF
jgi:hypothetical protein